MTYFVYLYLFFLNFYSLIYFIFGSAGSCLVLCSSCRGHGGVELDEGLGWGVGGLLSSGPTRVSHLGSFTGWRAWALGHSGFSGCASCALEHRISSCGLVALWHVGSSRIQD